MRPHPQSVARCALVCLAVACTHDQPMSVGSYTPGGPFGSVVPLRLTYNPGEDLGPVWLPDGSGFFYTMERLDRDDKDRCLVLMPAGGGSIEREICDRTPAADDSVDVYTSAAIAPDGRLAYVRATAPFAAGWPLAPHDQQLVVGSLTDPFTVRVLLPAIPYLGPSGRVHQGLAQLRWLGDGVLVYVGEAVEYAGIGIPLDTLRTGLEIVQLDLRGTTPALTMLPGTDQPSSVTVGAPGTLFFTVNGDSRVFRLTLADDSMVVVHDFGVGRVARDVQVVGERLVAVVGGSVIYQNDSAGGPVVRDHGGDVHLVDLASGADRSLAVRDILFRHLAIAPDGGAVVGEGYPLTVFLIRDSIGNVIAVDTTFARSDDLWRFDLR